MWLYSLEVNSDGLSGFLRPQSLVYVLQILLPVSSEYSTEEVVGKTQGGHGAFKWSHGGRDLRWVLDMSDRGSDRTALCLEIPARE